MRDPGRSRLWEAVIDFSDFYLDLHPRLVSTLTAVSGDADLAADAADEACAKALQRWRRVADMANPQGWVYRVALNEVRRKAKRRDMERAILRRQVVPREIPGPTGELWQLVAALPVRQREAIVLRHLADLTEPEIAEAMRVKRGTVSSTLRAAHERLRGDLEADHTVTLEGNRT